MSDSAHAHHSPTEVEPDKTSAAGMGVALACLAIVLAITAYLLYAYFLRESEAVQYSQVLSQQSEALQKVHAHEREVLAGYGVMDAEKGVYRVPVAEGIKLFVREARERQAAGAPQRILTIPAAEAAASDSEAPAQ